jgi:hypothetical protein
MEMLARGKHTSLFGPFVRKGKCLIKLAPGACTINLFTAVIVAGARVLATSIHLQPSLIFVGKAKTILLSGVP